ncbi:hypothetical protein ABT337_26015 [Saccharopolyspora hirsuta]|uniref:hypothetical protein n=1 Tax=Saccharopolyspora hirsuta TaxID=1837 RepID=UPI0014797A32|nr:hypothetical protein [Saccharopolyspora hirsuta]
MSAKLVRIGGIAAFVLGASFSLTPLAAGAAPGQAPSPVLAVDQDQDQGQDQTQDQDQDQKPDHGQCSPGDHNCTPPPNCKPEECPPPPPCKPGECEEVAPPPAVAPPPEVAPPPVAPPPVAPPPQQQQPQQQRPEQRPTVSPTQARPTQVPTAKPQAPMPTQRPQVEQKPVGGVQAGGGAMAQEQKTDGSGPLLAAGGLALTALAAGGAYLHRRRHAEQRN